MVIKKHNPFTSFFVFVLSFLFIFPINTFAEGINNTNGQIKTYDVYVSLSPEPERLSIVLYDDCLYASAADLEKLANCSHNLISSFIEFYRNDTGHLLFSTDKYLYSKDDNRLFVPLGEASDALCLNFEISDWKLFCSQYTSISELYRFITAVFNKKEYKLDSAVDNSVLFDAMEFFSRVYSSLPVVGQSSFLEEISGEGDQKRYDEAIAQILSSGSLEDLCSDIIDMDKQLRDWARVIEAAEDLLRVDDELFQYLEGKGISRDFLLLLAYEDNPYIPDLGDLFTEWADLSKKLDYPDLLKNLRTMAQVADTEISTITMLGKVFSDSDNHFLSDSVNRMVGLRLGQDASGVMKFYDYSVQNFIYNSLSKNIEDLIFSGDPLAPLLCDAIDQITDGSTLSDIGLTLPIFSEIIKDIREYYNSYSSYLLLEEQRELAILYLRANFAAYNAMSKGRDIKGTFTDVLNNAKATIQADLSTLLMNNISNIDAVPSTDNSHFVETLCILFSSDEDAVDSSFSNYKDSDPDRQSSLLSYAELLNKGIVLRKNASGSTCEADHYFLFDMNNDGLEEMIAYASSNSIEWAFAIFTYKDGQAIQIADSVNTCDISGWHNSAIKIEISNGILHAKASKTTVAYSAGSDNYLVFNGEYVNNYKTIDSLPISFGTNAFILISIDSDYGIMIGSDQDYLGHLYMQKHSITTSTPEPTSAPVSVSTESTESSTDIVLDGEYYGFLSSWTPNTMTVELFNYEGRNELSFNYMLTSTDQYYTFGITQATVWLDNAWSENNVGIQCNSIDEALNTEVWDGVTLREACTMEINFTVMDSQIDKIVFLYAA